MTFEKFRHYGYETGTYDLCRDLIISTNRHHLKIINTWFLLINLFHIIFSKINTFGMTTDTLPFYIIGFIVATGFEIILIFMPEFTKKHIRIIAYVDTLMLLVFGFVFSVLQPYMVAVTYQVFILLLSLSYIQNMVRMIMLALISGVAFVVGSFSLKAYAIAYQDAYNTLIFSVLAMVLHYAFQNARMKQFVTMIANEKISKELAIKSSFDTLTELVNRATFVDMANKAICEVGEDEYSILCMMDLDGFKQINDVYGHQVGDHAIKTAGDVIEETLGIDPGDKSSFPERAIIERSSFAGRLGGDEYIIIIRGSKDQTEVEDILKRLLKNLNSVRIGEIDGLHCSIGYTRIKPEDKGIDLPYHRADDALYESKRLGKNQINSVFAQ